MVFEARKLAIEQEGKGLKILTPNQTLKRLPIALAQIKAGLLFVSIKKDY